MRRPAIIIAFLSLSGCAELPAPPAPVDYACDDGKAFRVTYHPGSDSATIEISGMNFALRREPAASGAKYACDMLTFWSKGSEAFVETDGRRIHTNCREAAR